MTQFDLFMDQPVALGWLIIGVMAAGVLGFWIADALAQDKVRRSCELADEWRDEARLAREKLEKTQNELAVLRYDRQQAAERVELAKALADAQGPLDPLPPGHPHWGPDTDGCGEHLGTSPGMEATG